MHTRVHGSTVHNSPELETLQVLMGDKGINITNGVHSLSKEGPGQRTPRDLESKVQSEIGHQTANIKCDSIRLDPSHPVREGRSGGAKDLREEWGVSAS